MKARESPRLATYAILSIKIMKNKKNLPTNNKTIAHAPDLLISYVDLA